MILGIDISTTTVGFAIIDSAGKLIKADYVYLHLLNDLYEKANVVKESLHKLKNEYDIKRIAIEQNMMGFRRGASSAQTIITLARFNGIISYIVQEMFAIQPAMLSVTVARKSLKVPITKGCNVKEVVIDWVTQREKEYDWPTKILKSGPRKGSVVLEKGVEDACDAYVMAHALRLKIPSQ